MTFGLSQNDIDEILTALKRFDEIEEALVFGSRAKGNYKPGSDVDIAIKGNLVNHSCIMELSYILNEESLLPYYFDIVHYDRISEQELIQHIDRVGKLFYKRGAGKILRRDA